MRLPWMDRVRSRKLTEVDSSCEKISHVSTPKETGGGLAHICHDDGFGEFRHHLCGFTLASSQVSYEPKIISGRTRQEQAATTTQQECEIEEVAHTHGNENSGYVTVYSFWR